MKIDQHHTLEQLEQDVWKPSEMDSTLIKTCSELRKKPLKDFSTEDLRIMIGQNIGLDFLVPMALEQLQKNVLAKGDFYPGVLLESVLGIMYKFWKAQPETWFKVKTLYKLNQEMFEQDQAFKSIRKRYEQFEGVYEI